MEVVPFTGRWLQAAIKHAKGRTSMDGILKDCRSGAKQLFVIHDADTPSGVMVTEIRPYPEMKTCFIVLLGGVNFQRWRFLEAELGTWARALGCQKLEFQGRIGWLRKTHDWAVLGVYLEKDLVQ